jgi:ubiquinone/menaquinone biosynthesis C-methylase UbiE
MKIFRIFKRKIYNLIRIHRWKNIKGLLDKEGKTLLDVGCEELYFYNKLKSKYEITLADYSPKNALIKKENVQNLSFENKAFDIVLCQQVIEHVSNPVKAIFELKRVTKKQLIITVPYEPFFTLFRCLVWEKEHLWAITPKILKLYLGDPIYENTIFFKRYYVGVWKLN